MVGFVLDEKHPSVIQKLGEHTLDISLDQIFGYKTSHGYGLIMTTGSNTFIGAGYGFRVTFRHRATSPTNVGIAAVHEGTYQNGHWIPARRFNGDETEGGRAWRFLEARLSTGISSCILYRSA